MKNGKRDYQKEKKWDHENGRIKDRAQRNAARKKMEQEGRVKKGDGKQVDHKQGLGKGNNKSNLRVVSAKTNLQKEAQRKKREARR